MERFILKLPLSKLCAVPFALQNRVLFEVEKGAKRCREKGGKGQPTKGAYRKKIRAKTGQFKRDLYIYTEQKDAEGLGRKLLLTSSGDPRRAPESRLWIL